MWNILVFVLLCTSRITLAQDGDEASATIPPLSRLLEDLDAEFIDSLVNVADSLIDQVFPTTDISTTSTSSSSTTTAEPSTSISLIATVTSSEEESTTSSIETETTAANCCDDDEDDDDSDDDGDDDSLGIILGSVFGALALIALALLLFFCCRRRRAKKRKMKDVTTVEKDPADSEAFLPASPTLVRTTTTTDGSNAYTGTTIPPPPPHLSPSSWAGNLDQRGQDVPSSPSYERHLSTQPFVAPPRRITATGMQQERRPSGRPVVHPGIGELPADVDNKQMRESTPSANGAASELSSEKTHDGRNSPGMLPTNTNTVSSIANTDATHDDSLPSTLENSSSRPPGTGNGGVVAPGLSRQVSAKGFDSGPGPYDSDIAFRDQLSRSPPPIAKIPAQFNPYASDENIYENPTDTHGFNTRVQSIPGLRTSSNYFDYLPSSKRHESYNSSTSSSGIGIGNNTKNSSSSSNNSRFRDAPTSNTRETHSQPQIHPKPPSLITSSLPQHKNSTDGFGEVSPLVSPLVRNPIQSHPRQRYSPLASPGQETNFDFGFNGGGGHRSGNAAVR